MNYLLERMIGELFIVDGCWGWLVKLCGTVRQAQLMNANNDEVDRATR